MTEPPQDATSSTMWTRFYALQSKRVICHDIQNIQIVWIKIVVILRICRCRRQQFTDWTSASIRQKLENSQSPIHSKPLHCIGDQTHLARRDTNIFCNSSHLHLLSLLPNRRSPLTLAACMAMEAACRGKLAQFVTYHILGNIDRHMRLAIMHTNRHPHHLGEDRRSP